MDRVAQNRVDKLGGILEVAQAMVAERDLDRLLKMIVASAARVVEADRCTLFLVDAERGELWSKVALGITTREIRFGIGKGIAGAVAQTGRAVNIADAYADPRFNQSVDRETGYHTKAILCVPMRSLRGEVVGVLQALNKHGGDEVFTTEDEELMGALGGQAAAAVNNALLHQEIEQLFEGFVRASVVAIESRDPTTAGHSGRVARLSVGLADALPRAGPVAGRWNGAQLTVVERQELRYAALLHDFGKVGVREHVLVKANKLEPSELEILRARFETIFAREEAAHERKKVQVLLERPAEPQQAMIELDREFEARKRDLTGMFEFILGCNRPTVLPEGSFERLGEIATRLYSNPFGELRPYLTPNEVEKLSIRKGSLTLEERREIESHVSHTFRFLTQIPWTRALKRVPDIAYGHHEKLTGKGYPRGLGEPDIALQTRMMTISDIYDALTAADRPYKRAVPREKAFDILHDEAKRGDLDGDLLKVFIEADVPGHAPQEQ